MTLVTHAVVGTAVASIFPSHPVIAFLASFASHFISDAIPHWHYPVRSYSNDSVDPLNSDLLIGSHFFSDLLRIALDALTGLALSLFVFSQLGIPVLIIMAGVIGSILPDPLQFLYWKWRHEPLTSLQRFHIWIHSKKDIDHKHFSGILSQIAIISIAILFVRISNG